MVTFTCFSTRTPAPKVYMRLYKLMIGGRDKHRMGIICHSTIAVLQCEHAENMFTKDSLVSRTSSHSPPSHSISWFVVRSQSQLTDHEFTRLGVWRKFDEKLFGCPEDVQTSDWGGFANDLFDVVRGCDMNWPGRLKACGWICFCWSAWTPAHGPFIPMIIVGYLARWVVPADPQFTQILWREQLVLLVNPAMPCLACVQSTSHRSWLLWPSRRVCSLCSKSLKIQSSFTR